MRVSPVPTVGTLRLFALLCFCYSSMKIRIIEQSGLEGTLKGHLAQHPPQWAGRPSTRSGCSEPHPTWPWMFQGWGIYHLSGKPVPVFHHPHCKKFLPYT